ncbi:sulfatase-like hydrolase/transferase [Amycolatopsis jiangsuensis]|uniref:Arylsulfatase A-like enzyme n=1 Tax=Amycolatopsis jiangsuensis TaxID=1181879 RepID=A0A840ISN3_9PSEU|nr:sulfatase-like hydrolase/transferase [Amycolatopsis jiangsuensis]MBB4684004.1 arylsulfatase A-like enzyme [Amycolatopsis jiangsuensis]
MTHNPTRNILFLMTDQHSVSTLGCYGNPTVETPALDRLAATGTCFTDAFTPTAICTPARASLLTGAAPFRHRLLANYERNVGYLEDLAPDQFTFAEALGGAGWNLGLIGKWHGGVRRNAADYGFEGPDLQGWHNPVDHPDYLAYLAEHDLPGYRISEPIRGVTPNGGPGNLMAARLHQPVEATFEHYLATRTIEMMERFAAQDRPFYLAAHFFGPHLPYLLPPEYFDRYDPDEMELPVSATEETFEDKPSVQRNYSALWAHDTLDEATTRKLIAAYWGYVSLVDHELGRILDALDRLGLAGDTAVAMTADHGEFTGAHRLHDKGPAMYDEIYRIPALLRVPGAPAGQRRDEFVTLMDFTATILDLAGLPAVDAADGTSLLPLARGEAPPWRDRMLAEFHGHHFPYPQRMLRTRTHKLIVNPESTNELYDLRADPHELVNRIGDPELAPVRRALMADLYARLRDRGDNFYHWMTPMFEIGGADHDATLSAFET